MRDTLQQGLHGWEVPDCVVTMTHSGYWPRQSHAHGTFDASMSSTAGDFRNLTPLVLMAALRQASTEVLQPVHRFDLEVPQDVLGAALSALSRLQAVPHRTDPVATGFRLSGDIPAGQVHRLQMEVPTLTRGEGVLTSAFDHHEPVRGPAPSRQRTDLNPLNRKEYLVLVERGETTARGPPPILVDIMSLIGDTRVSVESGPWTAPQPSAGSRAATAPSPSVQGALAREGNRLGRSSLDARRAVNQKILCGRARHRAETSFAAANTS